MIWIPPTLSLCFFIFLGQIELHTLSPAERHVERHAMQLAWPHAERHAKYFKVNFFTTSMAQLAGQDQLAGH